MIKNLFKMTRARLVADVILFGIILALAAYFGSVLVMPLSSYRGEFTSLTDAEKQSESRLRAAVQTLAGDIGKRHTPVNRGVKPFRDTGFHLIEDSQ